MDELTQAVADSQQAGAVNDALVALVHKLCQQRCQRELAEDIAQHVLLGLVRHLNTIDLQGNVTGYVGQAIQNTFTYWMRTRSRERRNLIYQIEQALQAVPSHRRAKLRGATYASAQRMRKLKYY